MIKIKKNPTDYDFLESIKIIPKESSFSYRYEVYFRNEQIAVFEIKKGTNFIWEMEVWEDEYKRRGLATFMHKYIEKDLGIKIVPSKSLTRDGKLFYGIKPRT